MVGQSSGGFRLAERPEETDAPRSRRGDTCVRLATVWQVHLEVDAVAKRQPLGRRKIIWNETMGMRREDVGRRVTFVNSNFAKCWAACDPELPHGPCAKTWRLRSAAPPSRRRARRRPGNETQTRINQRATDYSITGKLDAHRKPGWNSCHDRIAVAQSCQWRHRWTVSSRAQLSHDCNTLRISKPDAEETIESEATRTCRVWSCSRRSSAAWCSLRARAARDLEPRRSAGPVPDSSLQKKFEFAVTSFTWVIWEELGMRTWTVMRWRLQRHEAEKKIEKSQHPHYIH